MKITISPSVFLISLVLLLSSLSGDVSTQQATIPAPSYTALTFNDIRGLSKDQITAHKTLYQGYINKQNEISNELATAVDRSAPASATYSKFRELKVEESFAYNGVVLHELYFENISGPHGTPGARTGALLQKSFGSYANWLADFTACAGCARGWVITAYSMDDNLVHNYVLDAHNQLVPVLTIPLIVFDAYEHAYMIDFGINRKDYIDKFIQNLNWSVVEARTTKWISKMM